ncbi:MAG: redoxin domain-containing protein [Thermoflexales bacterium]|nr:redoxin domain-containing protein [Thermoflexales bacterium]
MQCRTLAAQLGRLYPEIKAAQADVLVLLGDSPERARQYAQSMKLPFPVLADEARAVYHQFDLEKAYIVIQRTASVIVDQAGVIRYMKRATNPMIWLQESRELVDAVKAIATN